MRAWPARLLAAAWLAASAQPPAVQAQAGLPPVVEIAFEGNAVTRPQVMLRELVVRIGDPADSRAIERSRQALLDLGLFRRVRVREEPVDTGVRLVFEVDERYYVLPLPRGDAKSDGRYAYGAQLRWDNLAGLNHTLRIVAEQEDRQRQGIGRETNVFAAYDAPFVFDTPYGVGASTGYSTRPVAGERGEYTEDFRRLNVRGSRTYSVGPASQGLTVGGGLTWRQQRTSGEFAPEAYGNALSPALFVRHRDFHYRVYSETGEAWGAGVEAAREGWGSDYSFTSWDAAYIRYVDVGDTEHQTLHLRAYTGLYFSGPPDVRQYALGGSSVLRGYDSSFVEGNAYYYLTMEFARPLIWQWLRGVVILEAGNAFAAPGDFNFDRVYGSLGVGLRLRFSQFVDFEVELGYSIPLDGGRGRIFASRV